MLNFIRFQLKVTEWALDVRENYVNSQHRLTLFFKHIFFYILYNVLCNSVFDMWTASMSKRKGENDVI